MALLSNESQGSVKWVQSTVVKETNLLWGEAQCLSNQFPLFSTYDTQTKSNIYFCDLEQLKNRGIQADITVCIFAHLYMALHTGGNKLDMNWLQAAKELVKLYGE